MNFRTFIRLAATSAALLAMPVMAMAEPIRIAAGTGILFAPFHVMKEAKLIEKHAHAQGISLDMAFLNFPSGSAVTDALLSGNVDVVGAGISNHLLLWARTKGRVKALAAVSGTKSVLVTRDPAVKTLADFKPTNRISVTSLKISNQAIYLQMALDKQFGDPAKFDPMMVQLGFVDAVQAMITPNGAIDTMFAGPPYYQQLLARDGFHAVLTTLDVAGPTTNLTAFTTENWRKAHPGQVKVFLAALAEAQEIINKEPKRAAQLYLASTKEKFSIDDFAAMLSDSGNVFQSLPMGTFQTAAFMAKIGLIDRKPESWRDYFFDDIASLPGADKAD